MWTPCFSVTRSNKSLVDGVLLLLLTQTEWRCCRFLSTGRVHLHGRVRCRELLRHPGGPHLLLPHRDQGERQEEQRRRTTLTARPLTSPLLSSARASQNQTWKMVDGLPINDFSRGKMDATAAELVEERDTALDFLSQ